MQRGNRESVALPAEKGTYVLILCLCQTQRLTIGRLGSFIMGAGHYAYLGSAFGPGGVAARVGHHLDRAKSLRWHIDYLLTIAEPVEAWFASSDRKLEKDWADLMPRVPGLHPCIPRFGASDHRRGNKTSHLFYSRKRPSFAAFQQRLSDELEPGIHVRRADIQWPQSGAEE